MSHYHAETMDLNLEILIQIAGNENETIFRRVASSSYTKSQKVTSADIFATKRQQFIVLLSI